MTPVELAESQALATVPPPRREVEALAQRVLIIGLDGATFDILGPLMDEGYMPNLKRICDQGTSGILNSTKPPITLTDSTVSSNSSCHWPGNPSQ